MFNYSCFEIGCKFTKKYRNSTIIYNIYIAYLLGARIEFDDFNKVKYVNDGIILAT